MRTTTDDDGPKNVDLGKVGPILNPWGSWLVELFFYHNSATSDYTVESTTMRRNHIQ